jgi:hypothetical protein
VPETKPKTRDALSVVEVDGDAIIHDPRTRQLHYLNSGAAAVFGLCDGSATTSQNIRQLADAYGMARDLVASDIRDAVRALRVQGLLTGRHEAKAVPDERERVRRELPRST